MLSTSYTFLVDCPSTRCTDYLDCVFLEDRHQVHKQISPEVPAAHPL